MATVYSDHYALAQNGTTYIGKGPNPPKKDGPPQAFLAIVTLPVIAAADVVKIIPCPAGCRFSRLVAKITDIDSGTTITWSFGVTAAATAFGSSLTYGQTASVNTITDTVLLAAGATVAGDELIFTASAGPSTAAGTLTVYGEIVTV